ncbi:MAG: hypothetical protein DRJ44_03400 [Thermoprotei archaeon]|nr:MAG: hypothetical protein DRJ44_03400 [Thermoprotei archaeon]
MKKAYIVLLLVLSLAIALALLNVFSPQRNIQEISDLKDSRVLKEKFFFLYENDPEFKKSVDRLRELLFNTLEEYNKTEAWILFNSILKKLGLPEVELGDFKYGRGGLIPSPEPPLKLKPCCENCVNLSRIVKAIVIPRRDLEGGNGLKALYVCAYKGDFYGYPISERIILEVTLVFSDEDSPSHDVEYDVWRLIAWGRVEDIETFFIVLDEETGEIEKVSFRGLVIKMADWPNERRISPIGSGGAAFVSAAHELTVFQDVEEPLIIYVNAWNHALSLKDNNVFLDKYFYSLENIEIRVGRRIDAENDYSMLKYSSQNVQSLP